MNSFMRNAIKPPPKPKKKPLNQVFVLKKNTKPKKGKK